jgi:hypothetical protein
MDTIGHVSGLLMPYALGWFCALLVVRTVVVLRRGYKVDLGIPKGDPRRGILYSLTFSMLPWKKDSSRRHPWTYVGGMFMHVGIFATILFALGRLAWTWPEWMVLLFGVAAGVGWAGAFGLFLKRITKPYMHAISSPDDYFANVIVQLYLLAGLLAAFVPDTVSLWNLTTVVLLVYVPLGKIYHMLLFFVSRVLFGLQFGRRGVLRHDIPISY